MALVQTVTNVTARPVLNNGTDQSGNIRTLNGSFGSSLSVSEFSDANDAASTQKLLNIGTALEDCLSMTVYRYTKTVTKKFEDE